VKQESFCLVVLGSARTGLIFTRIQEWAQLGRADPTWPNRAGYSIPCAFMLGSGGGKLRGGNSLVAGELVAVVVEGSSLGRAVCVVFSPYLYRCCYCSLCSLFC